MILLTKKTRAAASKNRLARFLSLFVVLPFIFSACDMMDGSVDDYIEYNTGTARVAEVADITVKSTREGLIKTRQAWLHSPTEMEDGYANSIELEVKITNPYNYDLTITPVIYEFIGVNSQSTLPPIRLVSYDAEKRLATVRIDMVNQGDSFRIRLDMATKDGIRVFEPYMGIPKIVYDNPLRAPRAVEYYNDDPVKYPGSGDKYPEYPSYISWEMDGSDYHKGINAISLTFSSKSSSMAYRQYDFVYRDGKWEREGSFSELDEPYQYLITTDNTHFDFPFPFFEDPVTDAENGWTEGFSFLVTLKDKNGLDVTAGTGVSAETKLGDIKIKYHYRNTPDEELTDSPFVVQNWDKTLYNLLVPFGVDRVQFEITKGTEFEYGEQRIAWGASNTSSIITADEPIKPFYLVVGEKQFDMTVYWVYADEEPRPIYYTFLITRLSPNRDSTLKNLLVEDVVTGEQFFPDGGFQTDMAPIHDPDSSGQVTQEYTIYIPSSVNSIRLLGDYLNTSEIYDERGRTVGQAELEPVIIRDDLESFVDYEGYDERTYDAETLHDLKIIQRGWVHDISEPKTYQYRFYVKPEVDTNETLTRCYIITIKKIDQAGNPDAKLQSLTLTQTGGHGNSSLLTVPNTFNPDIENYTVFVPNGTTDISLSAETIPGAKIYALTSVDLGVSDHAGDDLPYMPQATSISNLSIPWEGVIKKRVTLEIMSGVDTTPRNYTITFVKSLPGLESVPELTGGNRHLTVSWSGDVPGASGYEVCYDAENQINPELARKVPEIFSSSPVVVPELTNFTRYNVWVRGKNGDRPGEWKKANSSENNGIPGPAELSALTPSVGSLVPAFSPAVTNYILVVPAETGGDFSVTPAVLHATQIFEKEMPSFPDQGSDARKTIRVDSPDRKTTNYYYIDVVRMLAAPVLAPLAAYTRSLKLSWNPDPAAEYYEVFYKKTAEEDRQAKVRRILATEGTVTMIDGLENGTPYTTWVRAQKTNGVVEYIYSNSSNRQTATPDDGYGGITLDLDAIPQSEVPNDVFTLGPADNLDLSVNLPLTININGTAAEYKWFIDGREAVSVFDLVVVNGKSLRVFPKYFTVGRHSISARIKSGDYWYSKTVEFVVQP